MRLRVLRKWLLATAVAGAGIALLAGPGLAGNQNGAQGDSSAHVYVEFDGARATIVSTKGISHYIVTDCTGELPKVELEGDIHSLEVGPFGSPVVSVMVKSGTTYETISSGFDCSEDGGDVEPPNEEGGLPPGLPDYCYDPELDALPFECWPENLIT
jgi:hypothetical protein